MWFRAPVFLISLFVFSVSVVTVSANSFSEGSQAEEYGLVGEEKAAFSGKVVDVLCELSGDCPANCGDGARLLGILRSADSALILVSKNAQFEFNGAAEDLLPFCNSDVDVDGLLVGDDPGMKAKVYLVQKIRPKGDAEWRKANQWTKVWAKRNPEAKGKGPWFRRDPRVLKQIEAEGYFGLGHVVDDAWRKENQ